MKRFPIRSLCTALLLTSVLAGCGVASPNATSPDSNSKSAETVKNGTKEQKLRLNIKTEPPTADPGLAQDAISMAVARSAFDGLIRLGEDGKLHESVAESYAISDDLKTYTFKLRNSTWSNGDAVTAKDFEYAWKRVLDPKTGSEYAYQLYYIKNGQKANAKTVPLDQVGVRALDDKTLEVQLENPTPFFLELLSSVTYYPVNQKVVESNEKWANDASTLVGNGPYIMKEWQHKSKITFEKNPTYWDKENVKLEKLEFNMIEDSTTELSMYDNNELDWSGSPLGDIPSDAIGTLKDKLHTQATAGTYWYVFNTKKAPFNNKKIRQAFAYAMNRQELIDNIVQTGGTAALGILPPSMSLNPSGYFKENNVEKAKKLLAEGLKEEKLSKLPEVELLYNTDELHAKLAQAIQDQWRKTLNVEVKLKNMELKVVREAMKEGSFQIARASWIGDFNDPINFLEVFKAEGGSNKSGWSNSTYTEILSQSSAEGNQEKRKELLKQADTMIMDEMPVTPIYYYTYKWLQKDDVKGVVIDALGFVDYKYARRE
ncbi:peptide ABC transporter substrate-binding protein [Brevibacillus laterosporus]|uniref:Peptide ABC transporter substrate-binding protein n=1 Tax=Brevibacillus laterosporus TaxID=1465 RepID=A0A502IKP2_BRELA|nr:peptide ABC transporter substrate-binding protein [Brevibacillus laterosporus]QDX93198.1 peptide ABC transporter substrate-binding protein [Brevibacillus laterosporus]TPG86895.1 peptide ABC transporter substrate-binding protein [Brevibacillus laterosporus]